MRPPNQISQSEATQVGSAIPAASSGRILEARQCMQRCCQAAFVAELCAVPAMWYPPLLAVAAVVWALLWGHALGGRRVAASSALGMLAALGIVTFPYLTISAWAGDALAPGPGHVVVLFALLGGVIWTLFGLGLRFVLPVLGALLASLCLFGLVSLVVQPNDLAIGIPPGDPSASVDWSGQLVQSRPYPPALIGLYLADLVGAVLAFPAFSAFAGLLCLYVLKRQKQRCGSK